MRGEEEGTRAGITAAQDYAQSVLKPRYFNEKYLIKDKNGAILKKSENLNQLINKTSWNKLKLVK